MEVHCHLGLVPQHPVRNKDLLRAGNVTNITNLGTITAHDFNDTHVNQTCFTENLY
jgi:hypothetical protein